MDNVVNEALGITKKQLHKQAVKTIKDPVKAGDNVVAQKPYGMPVYDKMVIDLEQFLAHLYTKHLNARISETSKLEIKKIIDEEIANIKQHILDEDLNFSRSKMPQVDTQNLSKAMDMVSDKAKITKGTISAGKLKKSQKELHQDKVEGIAKKFTSPDKFKPLVISKDNHIVDGHHRWGAAIYKWGEDVKIPIIRINLPILQAIKLYKEIALKLNQPVKETIKKVGDKYAVYPKRGGDRLGTHDTKSAAEKQLTAIEISKHKNEDINIPINIGDTILGGKFKNKRIVVKSIEKNEKGDITINGKPLLKYRLVSEGTISEIGDGSANSFKWQDKSNVSQKMKKLYQESEYMYHSNRHPLVQGVFHYNFNSDDGTKYIAGFDGFIKKLPPEFTFRPRPFDGYESEFNVFYNLHDHYYTGRELTTNKGNVLRIMSTMNEIINDFLVQAEKSGYPVKSLHISAKADSGKEHTLDSKRGRLYMAFIKKQLSNLKTKNKYSIDKKGDYGLYLKLVGVSEGIVTQNESSINEQKYYVAIHRPGLKPHLDRKTDVKADKILDEPKVFNSIADARDHIQSYKRFNRMHGYKGIKFWVSDLKMNKIDESSINEIPMGDLEKIDTFADKQLNPLDIVLTGRHFFDRLNDPRNGKEISNAELIGFFKRLSKKKKEFVEFLQNYNTLVAADDKTNINIPFMKQSNKAIAKTIMRKKDFKTPDKKLDI